MGPVLVDTSVWIRHFRDTDRLLVALIESRSAAVHEVVVGELSAGNLHQRKETLTILLRMPRLGNATFAEALWFVEKQGLAGKGLSWGDIHLLCAAMLQGTRIYTHDVRLHREAVTLGIAL